MTAYPPLEQTIDVEASPAEVWKLVTDVRRMSSWSHQVVRTAVLGGRVRLGARFVNLNHQGPKVWPTSAKVVRFEPHRDFAFRVAENRTVWSYSLEPTADGGTHVVHRREAPDGVSALSRVLTKAVLGGVESFTEELETGMARTLQRIKAEAEA